MADEVQVKGAQATGAQATGAQAEASAISTNQKRAERRARARAVASERRARARAHNRAVGRDRLSQFDGFANIAKISIALLLMVRVVYFLTGNDGNFSFATMLEVLQNAPVIDPNALLNLVEYTIQGNWGLFDFFRDFLNFFPFLINLVVTLVAMMWNVLVYAWYFIRILFGNNGV